MSFHLVVKFAVVLFYTFGLIWLSEAISCKGSAKYKLTFQAEWTEQSHPKDFPSNPHFSSLVGCTHNSSYVMWKPGILATKGVKDVAELGRTSAIDSEIEKEITLGNAFDHLKGPGIGAGNATSEVNDIEVNTKYPLVSVISMIAPSPDWFIGVRDYSLCNETTGEWVDRRVKNLFLYDAGTDSALTFEHTNNATSPPEPIVLITSTHAGSLKGNTERFGTFTFEKSSSEPSYPCEGSARYTLIFQAEWTPQSHPNDFPSDPHFSPVVGCSHNSSYVMWKPGQLASKGVKDVAELGQTTQLNLEIFEQHGLGNVHERFELPGIREGNGTSEMNYIEVNTEYPLVSAISMIAPSPDWFIGVHDYSLCNEISGEWIDRRVKNLFLYDAGTDSALNFTHTNNATDPPVPIFLITNTHEGSLKSNTTIKRFGTFTFERESAAIAIGSINVFVILNLLIAHLFVIS